MIPHAYHAINILWRVFCAVMMHKMLFGAFPFQADAAKEEARMQAVVHRVMEVSLSYQRERGWRWRGWVGWVLPRKTLACRPSCAALGSTLLYCCSL